MSRDTHRRVWAVAALLVATGSVAGAERVEPLPAPLEGVGIEEHLDGQVPLELRLVDESGRPVLLGDFFEGDRPVVLTLVYYRCPMLCTLVLDGLVEALRGVELEPGKEFEIVTVSIDPRETPALANQKKQNYVREYGHRGAALGWHFLTAEPEAIRSLADSVGFRYRYLKDRDEYAHAAAIFVLTPDGRVSRYLYGVRYDSRTVRLALVEASEGRVGSTIDQLLLFCYHYDASSGTYGPAAFKLMRIGGVVTLLILLVFLARAWAREARQRRAAGATGR